MRTARIRVDQVRTHMLLAALAVATCPLNAAENVVVPSAGVPLIAVAKPDQFVTKGQTVTLDASSSRLPAGLAWKYQWRQTAGPAVALRDTGRSQASFVAEAQADYGFELTIGDGQRASTDEVRVSVVDPTGIINGDFDHAGGGVRVRITASSAQPAYPADNAADGDPKSFWVSSGYKPGDAPSRKKPEWIRLEFEAPFTARSLRLVPRDEYGPRSFDLQVSDGAGAFRTVKSFKLGKKGSDSLEFPETTSRVFRFLFTSSHVKENVQVREVGLANMPPVVTAVPPLLAIKSGRDSFPEFGEKGPVRKLVEAPLAKPEAASGRLVIDPKSVIDLTAKVRPDGTLEWDVPPGNWTIVRTGYACNGDQIMCASPGAAGPSVDFLSKTATDFHFEHTAKILLQDAGPLVGKTLKYFHDDSWEAGLPNWTDSFLDDFKKYRGYDARPYLPVPAGHIMTSEEVSDRFLYDFRKTIGDCIADNHYGRLAELAHARGVKIHCEAGGPCYPRVPPLDALKNLGRTDIPMGEFWQSGHWKENGQNIAGKQTACAAHIYGKTFAAAEAFTKMGPRYEESPADLKPTADIAFCEGINRFFLHTWTSSRPEDGQPGFEYFAGTRFNRNVTWWPMAGAFFSYISRCQYLLQQGRFVADVCFIHRRAGKAEVYFVCNRTARTKKVHAIFRVSGKQPELWDAVTGEMRPAEAFRQEAGRTTVPLEFPAYGSCFVVFRKTIAPDAAGPKAWNYPVWSKARELTGGWVVKFDPKWGGPKAAQFDRLVNWTTRPEPGIKYYSGKATYQKTFDLPGDLLNVRQRIRLNLGVVKNVAEVRLNGRDLGVIWTEPFSVDISDAVKPAGNQLEIDVINLWPNRMIRDAALPAASRLTRSNISMDPKSRLLESGLLGPVALQVSQ